MTTDTLPPEDRKEWRPAAPSADSRYICVNCDQTYPGIEMRLEFGLRRDGLHWGCGWCTTCMSAEQRAYLDRKASLWVEQRRYVVPGAERWTGPTKTA